MHHSICCCTTAHFALCGGFCFWICWCYRTSIHPDALMDITSAALLSPTLLATVLCSDNVHPACCSAALVAVLCNISLAALPPSLRKKVTEPALTPGSMLASGQAPLSTATAAQIPEMLAEVLADVATHRHICCCNVRHTGKSAG